LLDLLDLFIDLATTAFALGAGFYALEIRNTFKGGLFERPWRAVGPAAVLYALAKITNILSDTISGGAVLSTIQSLLELAFVLTFFYGLYLFRNAWRPVLAPKKQP